MSGVRDVTRRKKVEKEWATKAPDELDQTVVVGRQKLSDKTRKMEGQRGRKREGVILR